MYQYKSKNHRNLQRNIRLLTFVCNLASVRHSFCLYTLLYIGRVMSHVPTVKRQVCHHDTLPLSSTQFN